MQREIGCIFDFISESNITSQDIYRNKGKYPVYSGITIGDGVVGYINSYKEDSEYLTFTSYGTNAGKLMYRDEKSTVGRNCMGLKLKKEYEGKINLKWFSYTYQNLLYKSRSNNKSGQKKLNKRLLEHVKINIPEISIQIQQLKLYEKLYLYKYKLREIGKKIEILLDKKIEQSYINDNIKYKDKLKVFFDFYGGNSGLTNENIYRNLSNNRELSIPIYSGSKQKRSTLGNISYNSIIKGKYIKTMNGPAILVIRKGLAGSMSIINDNKFTINDDVYVLIPKEEYRGKINLLWFIYEYEILFKRISTAKNGNGTFSKTYAEEQNIIIPNIEIQDSIAKNVSFLYDNKSKIEDVISKIEEVLAKDIEYV